MARWFSLDPSRVAQRLDAAVGNSVDGRRVRNAVLHVDSPRTGVRGTWAHGIADAAHGAPMRPDSPVLSASVGKIVMAATALLLEQKGALSLDGPIAEWVPVGNLHGLPVVGGEEALERITVRMLVANRSGLPDYFDDKVHPAKDGAPSLATRLVDEPDRAWTRERLIGYARDHYGPFAAPGERFLYSDLNWDLLGLVFEGVTGRPFYEVVRESVLAPYGMTRTWYHSFEDPPSGVDQGGNAPYADVFIGDVNLAGQPCLSLDQAGGGLAGPAEDFARLLRGLAEGASPLLSRLATDWTNDAMSRGIDYGYGTWRWRPGRIFFALSGLPELVGVSGSTNSYAYCSARGDVIAGTMNQSDEPSRHVRFVLSKVLPILNRAREV